MKKKYRGSKKVLHEKIQTGGKWEEGPCLLNIYYTVNNYRQVTGMTTGENFAFFIYRHFVEIL